MFSTHQTILAALVKDGHDAQWTYREEGDIDRVEALNALSRFDYDEMRKAEHDYAKVWDATFHGVALEDLVALRQGQRPPLEQMRAGFSSQPMTAPRAREITKVDSLVERLRAERRRRQHDAEGTPRM